MIEQKHNINWVTFLLAWVAGYCDTATFVSGDSIFSAHVTGNFIVFAAQVSSADTNAMAWMKLITFPVFVIAVMAGGWMADKFSRKYRILLVEGIILILSGMTAIILPILTGKEDHWVIYPVVVLTVVGMGLQNAFGKLFAKETHGPTTIMTGNVTQAALDLGNILRKGIAEDVLSLPSLKKLTITIGGFLSGCIIGAVMSRWIGLSTIMIPGVAIVICYLHSEIVMSKSEMNT